MRRNLLLLLMSTALLILPQCGEKEEASATGEKAAAGAQLPGPLTVEVPELTPPGLLSKLTVDAQGSAVLLAYKPTPEAVYQVSLHQVSAQKRADRRMEAGTEQTFNFNRKLVSQTDESWTVEMWLSNLQVSSDRKSKNKEMTAALTAVRDALELARFQVTTNGLGEVLKFEVTGGDASRWVGMKDVLEQMVKDSIVQLPGKEVAPGATWPTSRESVIKKRKTANRIVYDLNSTFMGYVEVEGVCTRCAVVRTNGEFTISGEVVVPGMKGKTSGSGKTDSVVVLNPETGVLVKSAVKTSSAQHFQVAGDDGGSMDFVEEMSTDFTQELAPGRKPGGKEAGGNDG